MAKILFIGAGASVGAMKNEPKPPLGQNLCEWMINQINIIDKLKKESKIAFIFFQHICNILKRSEKILKKNKEITNFEVLIKELKREDRIILQKSIQILFTVVFWQ